MTSTAAEPTSPGPSPWSARALLAAPIVFVGGWLVAGLTWSDYSPRREAISDLAAVDSPRRWFMFGVFVLYGVLMVVGSQALRRSVLRPGWPAAAINGLGLVAVASFPVHHSAFVDDRHGDAALVAYLSIAALPILAAWGLRKAGHGRLALASVLAGLASITFLASAYGNDWVGALQRTGAAIGNLWTLLAALALLRTPAAPPER